MVVVAAARSAPSLADASAAAQVAASATTAVAAVRIPDVCMGAASVRVREWDVTESKGPACPERTGAPSRLSGTFRAGRPGHTPRAVRQRASYAARIRSAATVAGSSPASTAARTSSRIARTPAEWRSRWSSSSRTSAQVKSSCWCGALVGEAVGAEVLAVGQHPVPDVVDADVLERRAGHDRRRPLAVAAHHPQRPGEVAGGDPGLLLAVAVGLVDRDHVGDLEDALLDALELVAGAGEGQEEERVDHAGHGDLGLPDADGLDEDHVVRRRLEHRHRLHGRPGDPAEGAGRRARAG